MSGKDKADGKPQETNSTTIQSANQARERECVHCCCQQKGRSRGLGCMIWALVLLLIIVLLACGVFSISAIVASADTGNTFTIKEVRKGDDNVVAVVNVHGLITENDTEGLFSVSTANTDRVVAELEDAYNDDSVKAIILDMDTPGGEVVASDIIYREVLKVRERKPVVAYASRMSASGGYYIASAADRFVVHPDAMTGSIGVILTLADYQGLYDKLGIKTKVFKSGKFKDTADIFEEPANTEHEKVFDDLVMEAYDDFVHAIVQGRGMSDAQVRKLGDGRIYTGRQAVDNGLADQLGYYEDSIAVAEDLAGITGSTVREYTTDSFLSSLTGALRPDVVPGAGMSGGHGSAGMYYLLDPSL